MQVSVEKVGNIGRKVSVVVPAQIVESAVQARLKKLSKTVKMQGFRPGKVPMKMVEQQYRGTATSDALGDLIQQTLPEALEKENLTPAVQPDITPELPEAGKDFSYVATFDVYPEFSKLDLEGVKISKPVSEVADEDVEKVIDNMRKQQITWKDVKRKSKKGDRVTLDFVGKIDGEEFDGGKAEGHAFVLGEGRMLPDFEKGATGLKAGDNADIDVAFPEDYQAENLKGKTAIFTLDIKTVSESELPEINEEFVKNFGIESGLIEDLKTEVTKNLSNNLESQLSSMTRQRVFDALIEQNEVDVPLKMVQEEAKRMTEEQKNQLQMQGIDPSLLPEPAFETLEPQAKKRVALGLAMMEVVRKNELSPDQEKVRAKIEKMASAYEDSKEFVDYYLSNQQALSQVQSLVLEEQVVDLLLEKAEIKDEKLKASEVLNMQ